MCINPANNVCLIWTFPPSSRREQGMFALHYHLPCLFKLMNYKLEKENQLKDKTPSSPRKNRIQLPQFPLCKSFLLRYISSLSFCHCCWKNIQYILIMVYPSHNKAFLFFWGGKDLFNLHINITGHQERKPRQEFKQCRNLEAGADTEAMEAGSLLACFSWLAQPIKPFFIDCFCLLCLRFNITAYCSWDLSPTFKFLDLKRNEPNEVS